MDCLKIVKMDIKELRKAVKNKNPKAAVSTMNKSQLSAILLGVSLPTKKDSSLKLFNKLKKEEKRFNDNIDKKVAKRNKDETMKQLKKPKIPPPLKKPKIPPPLVTPALPPQNTDAFIKSLTSVNQQRTINELKKKLPAYINEQKRQSTIRKKTPITKANIKKGLSKLKKNESKQFTSNFKPGFFRSGGVNIKQ